MSTAPVTVFDVAEEVADVVEPVFGQLGRIATTAAERIASGPRPASEAQLAVVRDQVFESLALDELTAGMGFVAAPGVIEGRDRYMLWWQRRQDRVARLRLNFDPNSVDVYDYLHMEWFQLASSGRQRVAFGPYVDYSGSELYAVTVTVPVRVGAEFVGVVGADLVVNELERRLVTVLQKCPHEIVLVGAERRVIAANTARWVVGTRLPSLPVTGAEFDEVVDVPSGTGWLLAAAADSSS